MTARGSDASKTAHAIAGRTLDTVASGASSLAFDDHWQALTHTSKAVNDARIALKDFAELLRTQDVNYDLPQNVHEAASGMLDALEAWRTDLVGTLAKQSQVLFENQTEAAAYRLNACRPPPSHEALEAASRGDLVAWCKVFDVPIATWRDTDEMLRERLVGLIA